MWCLRNRSFVTSFTERRSALVFGNEPDCPAVSSGMVQKCSILRATAVFVSSAGMEESPTIVEIRSCQIEGVIGRIVR